MKENRIKNMTVDGLWGNRNINIEFNEDVNILIGKNGTGKSTLLKILLAALNQTPVDNIKLKNLILTFFDKSTLNVHYNTISIDSGEMSLDSLNNDDFTKRIMDKIKNDILRDLRISSNKKIDKKLIKPIKEQIKKEFKVLFFSTFDMEIKNKNSALTLHDKDFIRTELDSILYNLINQFKLYQLKLKNILEEESNLIDQEIKSISTSINSTDKDLNLLKDLVRRKEKKSSEIYKSKENFKNILCKLYLDTNKTVDFDENNSLVFKIDNTTITPYDLSSGEKQILLILLNIVLTENKYCILIMDEPEISLHVEWQNDFIDNLKSLNNNMQIFIATHSPAIVTKGWKDKIIKMDNITTYIESK